MQMQSWLENSVTRLCNFWTLLTTFLFINVAEKIGDFLGLFWKKFIVGYKQSLDNFRNIWATILL